MPAHEHVPQARGNGAFINSFVDHLIKPRENPRERRIRTNFNLALGLTTEIIDRREATVRHHEPHARLVDSSRTPDSSQSSAGLTKTAYQQRPRESSSAHRIRS